MMILQATRVIDLRLRGDKHDGTADLVHLVPSKRQGASFDPDEADVIEVTGTLRRMDAFRIVTEPDIRARAVRLDLHPQELEE